MSFVARGFDSTAHLPPARLTTSTFWPTRASRAVGHGAGVSARLGRSAVPRTERGSRAASSRSAHGSLPTACSRAGLLAAIRLSYQRSHRSSSWLPTSLHSGRGSSSFR